MGIPVMILGESGSGKSTSMRNLNPETTLLIQPIKKALPFRSKEWVPYTSANPKGSVAFTDDYAIIHKLLNSAQKFGKTCIVIDDSNYLMTNSSLRRSDEVGFKKFVEFAKAHVDLIRHANDLSGNIPVYFMTHIQTDQEGRQRPKTIGKMLDDQVCMEGLFTIVLASKAVDGRHYFTTRNSGADCVKTPIGLFDEDSIDNDLNLVNNAINDYYGA
jgi:ribosomal protein L33